MKRLKSLVITFIGLASFLGVTKITAPDIFDWTIRTLNNILIEFKLPQVHFANLKPLFVDCVQVFIGTVALIIVSRFYFRLKRIRDLKTWQIVLSRDDVAAKEKVIALFHSLNDITSRRYLRLIMGNSVITYTLQKKENGDLVLYLTCLEKEFDVISGRMQDVWANLRFEPSKLELPKRSILALATFKSAKGFRMVINNKENINITESIFAMFDILPSGALVQYVLEPSKHKTLEEREVENNELENRNKNPR